MVGETTGLRICAAQRGLLILKCTARGQSGHVANAQMLGAENAIHKAARDIAKIAVMDFPAYNLASDADVRISVADMITRMASADLPELPAAPQLRDPDGTAEVGPSTLGEAGRRTEPATDLSLIHIWRCRRAI